MRQKTGFVMLWAVFFIAALLIITGLAVKLLSSNFGAVKDDLLRLRVFYAADGGVEWAKTTLLSNPSWVTDSPHFPADDIAWLVESANGHLIDLGPARSKIVREEGKGCFYVVGYVGESAGSARGVSIIKVNFTCPPFRQVSWKTI